MSTIIHIKGPTITIVNKQNIIINCLEDGSYIQARSNSEDDYEDDEKEKRERYEEENLL